MRGCRWRAALLALLRRAPGAKLTSLGDGFAHRGASEDFARRGGSQSSPPVQAAPLCGGTVWQMSQPFRRCTARVVQPGGMTTRPAELSTGRALMNKVPEVTIFFWIIKILST